MKQLKPLENQDCLRFNGDDLIIIDQIQNLPENGVYYADHVFMIICTEGRIEMTYDGRKMTLGPGEFFLGVPGSVLSDYILASNYDCKILAIKPSETAVPLELHKQMINTALHIKEHPIVQLSEEELHIFFNYYDLLCSRVQNPTHRYYDTEIRSLLNTILLYVLGIMDQNMEYNSTTTIHGEQIVEQFARMVNEDSGHHRTVEYYADRLNISAKYLSTLVRNTLDRTPTDIIKIVTIKEIERRLRYTKDSIKEISNALDFPNTSFFGKYFKHYTGMTPNSYRKKYNQ